MGNTTHIHMGALIAPINKRGLQRSMRRALATLDQLALMGKIENLRTPTGANYVRTFDVPTEHLRHVERVLQRQNIGYRKEPQ
jgi:hypothetical protein